MDAGVGGGGNFLGGGNGGNGGGSFRGGGGGATPFGSGGDGTFSNGAIDAWDWLKLDIGTVTGTVKYVSGTITYTKND